MRQYLLSVHHREGDEFPTGEAAQAIFEGVDRFNEEVQAAGAWVFAGGLETPDVTKVVDARSARVITTDGPYAESKEYLGGFWVITAEDLDAALAWAEKGSRACQGPVEVRPFQEGG